MENMDKGFTVTKWGLIDRPKIPQNLSAQFVCPSPKVLDFKEKRLHWVSEVRGCALVHSATTALPIIRVICMRSFASIRTKKLDGTLAPLALPIPPVLQYFCWDVSMSFAKRSKWTWIIQIKELWVIL